MTETLFLLGALGLAVIVAVRVGLRSRSSRAEGLQHAPAPGEVSGDLHPDPSPSPGGLHEITDSELLARAADAVDRAARCTPNVLEINDLLNLADALRDRAAQFAVLEALDTP